MYHIPRNAQAQHSAEQIYKSLIAFRNAGALSAMLSAGSSLWCHHPQTTPEEMLSFRELMRYGFAYQNPWVSVLIPHEM